MSSGLVGEVARLDKVEEYLLLFVFIFKSFKF